MAAAVDGVTGELVQERLVYYPTVTREPFRNRGRIGTSTGGFWAKPLACSWLIARISSRLARLGRIRC